MNNAIDEERDVLKERKETGGIKFNVENQTEDQILHWSHQKAPVNGGDL